MTEKAILRIGFLGHYGNQNLGDEATLQALLQRVRQYHPNSEIIIISPNPADTRKRYGVRVFPMHKGIDNPIESAPIQPDAAALQPGTTDRRWLAALKKSLFAQFFVRPLLHGFFALRNFIGELAFTGKCLRICRQMNLLIVSGGGQIDDTWNGAWGSPFTLLRWSLLTQVCGNRLFFLCLGAGPIHAQLSRHFFRIALNSANFRSFRDPKSAALVSAIGVREPNPVFPDMAYGLEARPPIPTNPNRQPIVGLSPMAFMDARSWPESDAHFYRKYVEKLADLAAWLLQRDYQVMLFATQLKMDPPVIVDITTALSQKFERLDRLSCHPVASVDEVMQVIAMTDYVITSRLHGVILSHLLARPVIALSYHPKIDSVLTEVSQSHLCLSITDFDLAQLIDRIAFVEANYEMLRSQIRHRVQANQQALQQQYEQLFRHQFIPVQTAGCCLAPGSFILERK